MYTHICMYTHDIYIYICICERGQKGRHMCWKQSLVMSLLFAHLAFITNQGARSSTAVTSARQIRAALEMLLVLLRRHAVAPWWSSGCRSSFRLCRARCVLCFNSDVGRVDVGAAKVI